MILVPSPLPSPGLNGTVRRLSERAFIVCGQLATAGALDNARVTFGSGQPASRIVTDVAGSGRKTFAIVIAQADKRVPASIELVAKDGRLLFEASWPANRLPGQVDLAKVLAEIDPANRPRILRQILETAGAWLQLHDDRRFVHSCTQLLTSRAIGMVPTRKAVSLSRNLLYCRFGGGGIQGDIDSVFLVGPGAVRRNAFRPRLVRSASGTAEIELVIERPDALGAGLASVIFFTRREILAASLDVADIVGLQALMPYLESLGTAAPDSRTYLLRSLKPYLASEPRLAGVFQEALQTLRSQPGRARTSTSSVAAGIDLAIPTPDGGLFIKGWLNDPSRLVQSMAAGTPFGSQRDIGLPQHRYRRPEIQRDQTLSGERQPGERLGFVSYAEGFKDPLTGGQSTLTLKLLSGAAVELVAPPPPASLTARRDLILSSIPYPELSPGMLADCIGPPSASLHKAHLATKSVEEEIQFGSRCATPAWSVVIPLYRDLEFLRFQLAAFAVDPDFRDAEIIFVLDSPEDRDRLERLLRSFLFVYDLPVRVLIHARNYGYAPAVNTGAGAASGKWLVPLNSDVVPIDAHWLSRLRAAALRQDRVGIVGPKLLFEDDSLQHAGLYYGRDLAGQWLNRHFYKGYPRDYGPARAARHVPGVTGACMLMERVLFERIGGFCEDYIIADYEDSDLCLRMFEAGRTCWYEPGVELYHLERQSVAKHEGYMRSVVSEYNRSLHQRRWGSLMTDIMREYGADGASSGSIPVDLIEVRSAAPAADRR